jgi:hypothetical protein
MRSWRKRETGLEAELRASRPEPSRELVHQLEARVHQDGRRARGGSFRVAFVASTAVGMLLALSSVGGLGYAATGAGHAVAKAKRIVHKHGVTQVHKSAARDQYGPRTRKKCPKGTKRVKGTNRCKKVKRARGVRFGRPPFTG